MAPLLNKLKALRWAGWDARVQAISAALSVATPEEAETLAEALISLADRRPSDLGALQALVGGWDRLTPDARAAAMAVGRARWTAALSTLLQDAAPGARKTACQIIATLGLTDLADQAAACLEHEDPQTRDAAEQAIMTLGERLARRDPELTTAQRSAISGAILRALDRVDQHRRTTVAALPAQIAGSAMPYPSAAAVKPLRPLLNDGSHPAHLILRNLLRRSSDGAMRSAAWAWLPIDALGAACAERLSERPKNDEMLALWPAHHLWGHPRRRSVLRKRATSKPDRMDATPITVPGRDASLDARVGFTKWAVNFPMHPKVQEAMLASVLTDPDPQVRHAAVRACARLASPPACLADFCFDENERVARSAALLLLGTSKHEALASADRLRLARALSRSPHESLRVLAAEAGAKPSRRTPAKPALPDLHNTTMPDAVLARQLIELRRTGLSRQFITDLVEFIKASSSSAVPTRPRSLATAIAALGDTIGGEIDGLLRNHLASPDPRVRANAIESLARRARRGAGHGPAVLSGSTSSLIDATIDVLTSGTVDEHHRVRAAAVRGLLHLAPRQAGLTTVATRTLAAMLDDDRPAHRIAALWVLDRFAPRFVQRSEILDRAAALARTASTPSELARAERVSARLMGMVRDGWRKRAQTVDQVAPIAPTESEAVA